MVLEAGDLETDLVFRLGVSTWTEVTCSGSGSVSGTGSVTGTDSGSTTSLSADSVS